MTVPDSLREEGCLDKTFEKGFTVRCTALFGITINFILFVLGFVITAYGGRLAVEERLQLDFLSTNSTESGDALEAYQEELSLTISSMSGLTVGMTVMGSFSIFVAVVGLCGSARSSIPCLYCYTILLVIILVSQAVVVGALSSHLQGLDTQAKEMIQESDAARDLVRQNGQQFLYFGAFAFALEFVGFIFALLARWWLKKRQDSREWGNEMNELETLGGVRDGFAEKVKKGKMRNAAIRLED